MSHNWLNSIGRATRNNSPVLLSALASAGVVATAVLAVRATPSAMGKLGALKEFKNGLEDSPEPSNLEKVQATWQCYVPAALAGTATIACIIGARRAGAKREASLIAAYTLADQAFRSYKEEVLAQIGENKERKVRDAVAIKDMEAHPNKEIILIEGSDVLCYETLTGRYFRANIEDIRRAEVEIAQEVIHNMYASLGMFFERIGLSNTRLGDELGWNIDHNIRLILTAHLDQDGKPCTAISYAELPVREYGKF
jgi:uncharacterized protein DUF6353